MARKEKKYHFIYKTTNVLSGKYYIGMHSTDNLDDGYMGSGKRLRYSINKYGKENHKVEILEFVDTRAELKAREAEIVNLNEIAKEECMNLVVGGQGGFISLEGAKKGREVTNTKYKDMINEWTSKGGKTTFIRHGIPKDFKYDWSGKNHSEETKQKMSESSKGTGKGSKNSQYGTRWITNEVDNKKIKKTDLIPEGWRLGRKIK